MAAEKFHAHYNTTTITALKSFKVKTLGTNLKPNSLIFVGKNRSLHMEWSGNKKCSITPVANVNKIYGQNKLRCVVAYFVAVVSYTSKMFITLAPVSSSLTSKY